jgi:putative DNA primase/helicase
MRDIERYFDVIHRYTPESAVIGLTSINGVYVNTRWYMKRFLPKLIEDALAIGQKANVYARVTPLNKPPDSGRGTERQSLGSSVLYLDYDSYKNQIDGLRALEAYKLPPSLVVNSGNGLHAYWLLDRMYSDQEALKARNKQLALDFGGKEEGGDSCFDLARVLRVPESYNVKHVDPLECSIVAYDAKRVYKLDQFEAAQLSDERAIDVWDSEPLSGDFIESLREKDAKLVKRILTEEGARKAEAPTNGDGKIDRSRNDAYIATRLLSLGYTAGVALSVLMSPEWFSGSKYNERKRYDYVVMTVNAALRAYSTSADRYFFKSTFIADKLANDLYSASTYVYMGERLWRYVNGVYIGDGEEYVKALVVKRLGVRWNSRASDETLRYLIDRSRVPLDRVNQHEGLINCANGMVDALNGQLLVHDPKYLSTVQIPTEYDATADTRAIDRFIADILPADAIPLFWQYVGSAFLTGRYVPKAFLTLVGPKDSGKSQVLKLLINFFGGSTNVTALSLQTLADNKFATAELFGKIANIFSDLDEAEAQNVGQIKSLTGGDKISGEQKFKGFFMFANAARVFFSSNGYPQVRAPDDAYFARAQIIPCSNHFGPDRADPFIVDKLSTPSNLSAVLLRAVEGLRQLIENNYALTRSKSVEAANEEYRYTADTVSGFLHSCAPDPDFYISKQQFYQLYRAACRSKNRKDVSEDKFFKRVAENLTRYAMVEEYRSMPDSTRVWCYGGRKPPYADNILVMPSMAEFAN